MMKGPSDKRIGMNFQTVLTYRCNLDCRWCNRYLDRKELRWKKGEDLSYEALKEGHKRVKAAGIRIDLIKVSGGENLLHPEFEKMMRYVAGVWGAESRRSVIVHTNGVLPQINGPGWLFNTDNKEKREGVVTSKALEFLPTMVSPLDLGLKPRYGIRCGCRWSEKCGKVFDIHGFSFCPVAGVMGRLLRIDTYSPVPIGQKNRGIPEICGHCPFSMGARGAKKLGRDAKVGKIDMPTKTYKKALQVVKDEGVFQMPLFEER